MANYSHPALESEITTRHIPKSSIPFSNEIKERLENELYIPSAAQLIQSDYRNQLVSYLESKDWDYFFTVTFRTPRCNPYSVLRDIKRAIPLNSFRRLFVAVEPHIDSPKNYHAHGLAKAATSYAAGTARDLWQSFFNSCGRSDVQRINSCEAVSSYCAKYVVKMKGEWDFIGNWRH